MKNKAYLKKQTKKIPPKKKKKNHRTNKQKTPKTKNKAKEPKCIIDYLFYQRSHLLTIS